MYRVFANKSLDSAPPELRDSSRIRFHRTRLPTRNPLVRILWEQMLLPLSLDSLDLLHCPVNVMPVLSQIPTVVTVHDLAFMVFRDKHLPAKRAYLTMMTRLACRRAAAVITVSDSTRSDVLRLLRVDASKVKAIQRRGWR